VQNQTQKLVLLFHVSFVFNCVGSSGARHCETSTYWRSDRCWFCNDAFCCTELCISSWKMKKSRTFRLLKRFSRSSTWNRPRFNRSLTDVWPWFLRGSTLVVDRAIGQQKVKKPFGWLEAKPPKPVRLCWKSVWPQSNHGWTNSRTKVEPVWPQSNQGWTNSRTKAEPVWPQSNRGWTNSRTNSRTPVEPTVEPRVNQQSDQGWTFIADRVILDF
jgi:hypothetical protein